MSNVKVFAMQDCRLSMTDYTDQEQQQKQIFIKTWSTFSTN